MSESMINDSAAMDKINPFAPGTEPQPPVRRASQRPLSVPRNASRIACGLTRATGNDTAGFCAKKRATCATSDEIHGRRIDGAASPCADAVEDEDDEELDGGILGLLGWAPAVVAFVGLAVLRFRA